MTPERLAEIHTAGARWAEGDLKNPTTTSVFRHRAELLAEVDRLLAYVDYLKGNLRSAGECIDAYVTACARGEAEIARLTAGQQPRCAFEPPCAECQRRESL